MAILNWNGRKLLEQFLPSVTTHCPDYASVYVIDNASTDDSVDYLAQHFPQVNVILLDRNYGFAGGYNLGLKQISAEYFILLNSDVEVTENWIDPVIRMMDEDPSIAGAQPKIRAFHRPDEFEYAGAAGGYLDKWGFPFCRGRIFYVFEKDQGQYNDAREIFWATGCALFMRSELYARAGGLDEDFFAHMEEIDLCWRLKNMGYSFYYHPGSTVFHVGGGTLLMGTPKKTFLNFRNNLMLMTKNLPKRKFLPLLILRLFVDGVAALSFLPHAHGWGNFWAVFRAHMSYYRNFTATLRKRKTIPKRSVSCIYRKSIVWQFYALKKRKFSELGDHFT